MDEKMLLAVGAVAVVGIGVLVYSSAGTSSTTGTDANSASVDNTIVAANTQAINTGAQLQEDMIAAATSLATVHDNNQTSLAIAANNGATQTQLASIATNSTQTSALLNAATSVQNTLANSDVTKYVADLNAQTGQLASYYGAITAQNNDSASTAIAQIQGNTATSTANAQSSTQTAIAAQQASAEETASNDNIFSSLLGGISSIVPFFSGLFGGGSSSDPLLASSAATNATIAPLTVQPTTLTAGQGLSITNFLQPAKVA